MSIRLGNTIIAKTGLGEPGPAGKSAYEIAKEQGFAGTEEQFGQALVEILSYMTQEEIDALLATKGYATTASVPGIKVNSAAAADTATTAAKVSNALTFGAKTYDGSSAQTITAEDLNIVVNTASNTTKGIVQGSTEQDKISVDAGGTMTVNNISATKIVGTVTSATNATTATNALSLGGTAAADYALKAAIPTDTSQLANGAGYQTSTQVQAAIDAVVGDINTILDSIIG